MDNYALVNDIASVWKYADEMFPAFGSISIDWDGAFGAFLPRALAAKDEKEAQLLLCEFLNLLEDGHTDYTPPRAFRDGIGYLPFEPDYAGGKWHIGGANEALSAHIVAVPFYTLSVGKLKEQDAFTSCSLAKPATC